MRGNIEIDKTLQNAGEIKVDPLVESPDRVREDRLEKETPERRSLLILAEAFLMDETIEENLLSLDNEHLIREIQRRFQEHLKKEK